MLNCVLVEVREQINRKAFQKIKEFVLSFSFSQIFYKKFEEICLTFSLQKISADSSTLSSEETKKCLFLIKLQSLQWLIFSFMKGTLFLFIFLSFH